jgi:hypothetical protein
MASFIESIFVEACRCTILVQPISGIINAEQFIERSC